MSSPSSSGCGCLMLPGYGTGALVAAVCSVSANHSILWMLWDMLFSWFYVLYFLFFKYGTFHAATDVLRRFFA